MKQCLSRPVEMRYNPYTQQVEVIDSVKSMESMVSQMRQELHHLNNALRNFKANPIAAKWIVGEILFVIHDTLNCWCFKKIISRDMVQNTIIRPVQYLKMLDYSNDMGSTQSISPYTFWQLVPQLKLCDAWSTNPFALRKTWVISELSFQRKGRVFSPPPPRLSLRSILTYLLARRVSCLQTTTLTPHPFLSTGLCLCCLPFDKLYRVLLLSGWGHP